MLTTTLNWDDLSSSQFLDNVFINGDQTQPAITATSAGYIATWMDPNGSPSVEGRFVTSDGTPQGSEFVVNTTTANSQSNPSMATMANGNVVVTFTDTSTDPGGDIRARFLSPTGVGIGNDFAIQAVTSDDSQSSVAALPDGKFVVSWTRDFGGGDTDVRAEIFNPDGSPLTGTVLQPSSTSSALMSNHSSVAALAADNFVVAWEEQPAAGGSTSVLFRRFDSTGAALDPVNGVLIDNFGTINSDIHVVGLADGGFAVAYTDNGWNIDGTEITARVFNGDGTARSGFIRVNTNTVGNQNLPSITALSNGGFVVGWNDNSSENYQAYDANGSALGSNFTAFGSNVEGEVAAQSHVEGGVIVNSRTSSVAETGGSGDSQRTSTAELTRTITSDGAADTLTGDALDDTLIGGGGADIMTGGLGNDKFVYNSPTEGGDTITDFRTGEDKLVISKAGFGLGAGVTLGSGLDFVFDPANEHNGTPALLQQNGDLFFDPDGSGATAATLLAHLTLGKPIGNAPTQEFLAHGDFNRDGTDDLVVRNTDGSTEIWKMDNGHIEGVQPAGNTAGWSVVSVGDYNNDHTQDIMWRNDTSGVTEIWTMDDGVVKHAVDYGNTTGWTPVAQGDYNADGNTDVLWRNNTSGVTEIWTMKNGTVFSASDYGNTTGWTLVARGDFNNDGTDDVMWRNDTSGVTEIWSMKNGAVQSASDYGATVGWEVVGAGDFNGDGTTDVIWRNTSSGLTETWTIKNGVVQSASDYGATLGWNVVGVGDINHDGTADLVWQNTVSGMIDIWDMINGSVARATDINMSGYAVVGQGAFEGVPNEHDLIWRQGSTGNIIEGSYGVHLSDVQLT